MHPEAVSLKGVYHESYQANAFKQFWYLFIRSMQNHYRLPITSYIRVIIDIIQAIMLILVYGKLGHDVNSIQSRNGWFNFVSTLYFFNTLTGVTLIFPDERPVYLREKARRQYGAAAYFLSKSISEVPFLIFNTVLVFVMTYFACGLNTESSKQPIIFLFYSLLFNWAATGCGFMFSMIIKDKQVALDMTPMIIIPSMVVSGFFVDQNNMVPLIYPLRYLSLIKYSFQVYILNEYDGLHLDCYPD